MSTNALSQVYKHGILALEQCNLTQDVFAGANTIHVLGYYMTQTPFVIGNTYVLMDDSFAAGANGAPNCERVMVTGISLVSTRIVDHIGYSVSGTITVQGYITNGWSGGLLNSYTTANNAVILTPGIEVAIQSEDFNCRFKTLTDAPKIDMDDESSRFASGDEGRDLAIAGARSGDITFTEKVSWAGSVTAIPTYAKIMKAMGHLVKKYTTTGIEFLPSVFANEITATIWIVNPENGAAPTYTVYRYCGAHGGNGSTLSASKVGDPYMLTGKLSAAYVGTYEISYAHARVLTSPDTNVPEVLLSNTVTVPAVYGHAVVSPVSCATVAALTTAESLMAGSRFYTADGTDTQDGALAIAKGSAIKKGDAFIMSVGDTACTFASGTKTVEISQFSLDFGGVVTPFIDQSTATGNAYYKTDDRDPKLTINPYHVRKSADDVDYVVTQQVEGIITIASALSNPHITTTIARSQLMSPGIASREGYVNTSRTYKCNRNNTGSGAMVSALPDGCVYGILIGARS